MLHQRNQNNAFNTQFVALWHQFNTAATENIHIQNYSLFQVANCTKKLEFAHEGDQSQDILLLETYASAKELIEGIFIFVISSPTITEAKWSSSPFGMSMLCSQHT